MVFRLTILTKEIKRTIERKSMPMDYEMPGVLISIMKQVYCGPVMSVKIKLKRLISLKKEGTMAGELWKPMNVLNPASATRKILYPRFGVINNPAALVNQSPEVMYVAIKIYRAWKENMFMAIMFLATSGH